MAWRDMLPGYREEINLVERLGGGIGRYDSWLSRSSSGSIVWVRCDFNRIGGCDWNRIVLTWVDFMSEVEVGSGRRRLFGLRS
jgi:hypothetical protein